MIILQQQNHLHGFQLEHYEKDYSHNFYFGKPVG